MAATRYGPGAASNCSGRAPRGARHARNIHWNVSCWGSTTRNVCKMVTLESHAWWWWWVGVGDGGWVLGVWDGWVGRGGVVVVVVVVVVGGADVMYDTCLCRYAPTHATNSGGRTPGSKLPASPPPLPRRDGGGTPGRVPVYTAQKATRRHATNCNCGDLRSFLHVKTSNCHCTSTGMSTTLMKNCNSGTSTVICTPRPKT